MKSLQRLHPNKSKLPTGMDSYAVLCAHLVNSEARDYTLLRNDPNTALRLQQTIIQRGLSNGFPVSFFRELLYEK